MRYAVRYTVHSRCWCKKVNTLCTGHAVHAAGVCAKRSTNVCSTQYAVVYGGEDIVFGAKRSNQSRQWTQWNTGIWWWGHCLWCKKVKPEDAVDAVTQWNSGIWWWGHCLWCKKVKPVDSVDAVTQWRQYTV